ncbi:MAG: nucleotidyltransferase family protein [Acidobacteria bacterium]|nr:nucleotidyltransferase family protein [Acidobacteriota bacterium]
MADTVATALAGGASLGKVPGGAALALLVRTKATLAKASEVLDGAGVPWVVLKGPQLACTVYPSPVDRDWVDLDLLVPPARFAAATAALAGAGFAPLPGEPGRAATEARFYHAALEGPHGLPVELHRDLCSQKRYPVDVDAMLRRAVAFDFLGLPARGLGAEDLLLHLCLHMAGSHFNVARKHVTDLARVAARLPLAWPVFLEGAAAARCRVGAFYALTAAVRQDGAAVPGAVLAALEPSARRRRWLDRHLDPAAFPVSRLAAGGAWAARWKLGFALMDRVRDWPGVALRYLGVRGMDVVKRL